MSKKNETLRLKSINLNNDTELSIIKNVAHNLTELTKGMSWNVTDPLSECQCYDSQSGSLRPFTTDELNTHVFYGVNKVYIGGGWEGYGEVGSVIRSIEIGKERELTAFGELLTAMDNFYKQKATSGEIECMRNRYFDKKNFDLSFPDKSKITFANWLGPHDYFEGPMWLSTEDDSYKNMWCFGYGS